jgi:hypothetical protein
MNIIINHNNDTIEINDKLIQLRKISTHTLERIINTIFDEVVKFDGMSDKSAMMIYTTLKSIDEDKETVIGEW